MLFIKIKGSVKMVIILFIFSLSVKPLINKTAILERKTKIILRENTGNIKNFIYKD